MNEPLILALRGLLGDRLEERVGEPLALVTSEREIAAIFELLRAHGGQLGVDVTIGRKLLDGIGPVDPQSAVVHAGSGASLQAIDRAAALAGLSIGPLSPGSEGLLLGELIDGPYSGLRSVPCGRLESICLSLEAVMPDGRTFHSHASPRSAAGPELDALFCGSLGAAGFMTAGTVRLMPRPIATRAVAFRFARGARAVSALRRSLADGCWVSTARIFHERGRVQLEATLAGTARGLERDRESLARRARALEGSAAEPVTREASATVVPECELDWPAVVAAVDRGVGVRLYRLSLETAIAVPVHAGAALGGLPLSKPTEPHGAWLELKQQIDPPRTGMH